MGGQMGYSGAIIVGALCLLYIVSALCKLKRGDFSEDILHN
jgi:hypothetical protein